MKKIVLALLTLLIGTSSIASPQASKIIGLAAAFKNQSAIHKPTTSKHPLEIVYGGADIERSILETSAIAV